MTYSVTIAPAAEQQLRKLEAPVRRRIQAAIDLLSAEPRLPKAIQLVGDETILLKMDRLAETGLVVASRGQTQIETGLVVTSRPNMSPLVRSRRGTLSSGHH